MSEITKLYCTSMSVYICNSVFSCMMCFNAKAAEMSAFATSVTLQVSRVEELSNENEISDVLIFNPLHPVAF